MLLTFSILLLTVTTSTSVCAPPQYVEQAPTFISQMDPTLESVLLKLETNKLGLRTHVFMIAGLPPPLLKALDDALTQVESLLPSCQDVSLESSSDYPDNIGNRVAAILLKNESANVHLSDPRNLRKLHSLGVLFDSVDILALLNLASKDKRPLFKKQAEDIYYRKLPRLTLPDQSFPALIGSCDHLSYVYLMNGAIKFSDMTLFDLLLCDPRSPEFVYGVPTMQSPLQYAFFKGELLMALRLASIPGMDLTRSNPNESCAFRYLQLDVVDIHDFFSTFPAELRLTLIQTDPGHLVRCLRILYLCKYDHAIPLIQAILRQPKMGYFINMAVRFPKEGDEKRRTLMEWAFFDMRPDVMRLLLTTFPLVQYDREKLDAELIEKVEDALDRGDVVFFWTLFRNHLEYGLLDGLQLLLPPGALARAVNLQNSTTLHLAFRMGVYELVGFLVKVDGADIEAKDALNRVPFSHFEPTMASLPLLIQYVPAEHVLALVRSDEVNFFTKLLRTLPSAPGLLQYMACMPLLFDMLFNKSQYESPRSVNVQSDCVLSPAVIKNVESERLVHDNWNPVDSDLSILVTRYSAISPLYHIDTETP